MNRLFLLVVLLNNLNFSFSYYQGVNASSLTIEEILKDKPDFLKDNDYINKLYKQFSLRNSSEPSKTLKIV